MVQIGRSMIKIKLKKVGESISGLKLDLVACKINRIQPGLGIATAQTSLTFVPSDFRAEKLYLPKEDSHMKPWTKYVFLLQAFLRSLIRFLNCYGESPRKFWVRTSFDISEVAHLIDANDGGVETKCLTSSLTGAPHRRRTAMFLQNPPHVQLNICPHLVCILVMFFLFVQEPLVSSSRCLFLSRITFLPEGPRYVFYCKRRTCNGKPSTFEEEAKIKAWVRDERGTNNASLPIGSIEIQSGRHQQWRTRLTEDTMIQVFRVHRPKPTIGGAKTRQFWPTRVSRYTIICISADKNHSL